MKKIIFNKFVLGIILLVLSESMLKTPLQNTSIFLNLIITFLSGLLFLNFLIFDFKKIKKDNKFIYKYVLILCLLPIIAAIKANIVFNQSVISGFTGNISFYNFLVIFYFFYFYRYKKNATQVIKKIALFLAWVYLITFYSIRIFMQDYSTEFSSFDGLTSYSFGVNNLGSILFIWMAFYYFSKYVVTKKSINILFFLLFIGYDVILANARTTILGLLFVMLWYYFKEFSKSLKIKFIFSVSIILLIVLIGTSFIPSIQSFYGEKVSLFSDATSVIKGNEGEDASANARLFEIEIASRYIDHIWLGAGTLKSSTKELYLPDYFYPSDIGLIGVIFNYGIIGLVILLYQLKIFSNFFKNKMLINDVFLKGILYFLLFIYFKSIITGQFVYSIGFVFILLSVVFFEKNRIEEYSVNHVN